RVFDSDPRVSGSRDDAALYHLVSLGVLMRQRFIAIGIASTLVLIAAVGAYAANDNAKALVDPVATDTPAATDTPGGVATDTPAPPETPTSTDTPLGATDTPPPIEHA